MDRLIPRESYMEWLEAFRDKPLVKVLTGHAHGGQWRLPFTTLCGYSPDQHFFPKYATGRYELSNGTLMLVCRGLARESTPLPRFFNHPSLMIVDVLGRGNR